MVPERDRPVGMIAQATGDAMTLGPCGVNTFIQPPTLREPLQAHPRRRDSRSPTSRRSSKICVVAGSRSKPSRSRASKYKARWRSGAPRSASSVVLPWRSRQISKRNPHPGRLEHPATASRSSPRGIRAAVWLSVQRTTSCSRLRVDVGEPTKVIRAGAQALLLGQPAVGNVDRGCRAGRPRGRPCD